MSEPVGILRETEVAPNAPSMPNFVGKILIHKGERFYAGLSKTAGYIVFRNVSSLPIVGEEVTLPPSIYPFDADYIYALRQNIPAVEHVLPFPQENAAGHLLEQRMPTVRVLDEFRKSLIAAGAHALPFQYAHGDKTDGKEFSWHFIAGCMAGKEPFIPIATEIEWCLHDTYDHGVGLCAIPAISMAVLSDLAYRAQLLRRAGAITSAARFEESIWSSIDYCSGAFRISSASAQQTPVTDLIQHVYSHPLGDSLTVLQSCLGDFGILRKDQTLFDYHGRLHEVWPEEVAASQKIMDVLRTPPPQRCKT